MHSRNYRDGNIPEIGSTIYDTIPTGGDTFFDELFDSKQNGRGRRSRRETGLGTSQAKSFNISRYVFSTVRFAFLQQKSFVHLAFLGK